MLPGVDVFVSQDTGYLGCHQVLPESELVFPGKHVLDMTDWLISSRQSFLKMWSADQHAKRGQHIRHHTFP